MRFAEKIMRFMSGRCGMDALNNALFYAYLILWIVSLFVKSAVLSGLCTVIVLYMLFRCFSRNLEARRRENMAWWNLKTKLSQKCAKTPILKNIAAFGKKLSVRAKNLPTKRYRTCPHCRAELCLPRKTGKHTVRCPRCTKEFGVRIIF